MVVPIERECPETCPPKWRQDGPFPAIIHLRLATIERLFRLSSNCISTFSSA